MICSVTYSGRWPLHSKFQTKESMNTNLNPKLPFVPSKLENENFATMKLLFCHRANGFRQFAVLKLSTPAKMPGSDL